MERLQRSDWALRSLVLSHVCRTNPRLSEVEVPAGAGGGGDRSRRRTLSGTLAALVTNVADLGRRPGAGGH